MGKSEVKNGKLKNKKISVVSLFDGVSCGRTALERAGFKIGKYAAFEIDKYAKSISRFNYPDILQCGDVMNADFTAFIGADIVIGGSPCQAWSIARTNREVDKTGIGWQLFMRFVDAVKTIKPQYFLYENVASMPLAIKEYISEELGVSPILINSALVSAQQRKRLYWTNIKGVCQPQDKEILLQDILEKVDYDLPYGQTFGAALRTRKNDFGKFKHLEVRKDGKTNALTSVSTDSCVCEPVRLGEIGKGGQGNRIYSVKGKSVCISANSGGFGGKTGLYKIDLTDGDYVIRKLSPIETERCQTMPDNYTAFGIDENGKRVKISNSRRYKCCGNGWTVDVVAHILKNIN